MPSVLIEVQKCQHLILKGHGTNRAERGFENENVLNNEWIGSLTFFFFRPEILQLVKANISFNIARKELYVLPISIGFIISSLKRLESIGL